MTNLEIKRDLKIKKNVKFTFEEDKMTQRGAEV
jgi:hypothetical protein